MKKGKVPENILDRAIMKQIKLKKEEVLSEPGIGRDFQELYFKDSHIITANTFRAYLHEKDAAVAFYKVLSNFMMSRGMPVGLEVTVLMPVKTEESLLRAIMKELSQAAKEENIKIIGGHTEWVEGIKVPMITLHMTGKKELNLCTGMPEAEDEIILVNPAGILGTYEILLEKKEELKKRFSNRFLDQEESLFKNLSIRKAVEVLHGFDISVMHDVSKGGIFAGLWELSMLCKKGMEVDLCKILLKQLTIELCEQYDLNPYQLDGSGAFLFVTRKGGRIIAELEKAGIEACSIGFLTDTKDRIVYNEEERRFLEPFRKEESHKII